MKAILINASNRTVTEVEYDGNFRNLQKLIGCDCFTLAPLNSENAADDVSLFVDDEGLLKAPEEFFHIAGVTLYPLAGNGVILGVDYEGNSVDSPVDVADIESRIVFLNRSLMSAFAW